MRAPSAGEVLLAAVAAACFLFGSGERAARRPPTPSLARDPAHMRVLTWNVGGAGGEWGHLLADEDVEHVAALVRALDPDLAFLQEVGVGLQVGRLRRALGEGWHGALGGSGRGRRVVAFARRGTLERRAPEGVADDALFVVLEREDGRRVVAVGLHADVASAAARNAEIGGALAALERLAREERADGRVLAGDLNIDLDLDKRRDLFTDDLHRDVETYNVVAEELLDAARGTGSTAEPDRRLDYVFADPAAFEVVAAGPIAASRRGDMDHEPVVADLRFRQ